MMDTVSIVWFRKDLRLSDNPALLAGVKAGKVLPIYIYDEVNAGENKMGAASQWWLHYSLGALNKSLGGCLSIFKGDPQEVFSQILKQQNIKNIYWNRCYEPWEIKRDAKLKQHLKSLNVNVESFNGSLLWEPWDVKKKDGTPYKVFTPFYRKGCLQGKPPREALGQSKIDVLPLVEGNISIADLNLLPSKIRWDKSLEPHWEIGEEGAQKQLQKFLDENLHDYKKGRDFPAKERVSKLSPYLHFGEISPHQIWDTLKDAMVDGNVDHFLSELGWREFSYYLLYHNPKLPTENIQSKFDHFPWSDDAAKLKAWQQGQTGIPIVDAGMRELWQTGFMHNRVRMVVASFLVKNLKQHWKHGERWFWDTLVDADLANNCASWQWVSGCGADAAPFFRIFNPTTQGQKFDSEGDYIRHYVPELKDVPNKYLFNPWEAPESTLVLANVKLGQDYPMPIADLKVSREQALEAYKSIK